MTARKHPDTPTPDGDVATAQAENAEVQAKADESLEKGYIGEVSDPHPNEAYSILTGPDSPPLHEDDRTRFAQPSAPSTKETA